MHVQHLLHGFAGHADLLAGDAVARGEAAGDKALLDAIGIADVEPEPAAAERRHRRARDERVVEFVAECGDLVVVHGGKRVALPRTSRGSQGRSRRQNEYLALKAT
ncbi:hypothetical protein D9M69_669270 [compost metagenome]